MLAWLSAAGRGYQTRINRILRAGLRGGGSKSGDGQALSTGVVLGEPGFVLGERGKRDRFRARRGESLFSPAEKRLGEELKKPAAAVLKPKQLVRREMWSLAS